MIAFPRFTTPGGEELVVVPRAEFERLVALAAEAEEDADDLRTYLSAKAEFERSGGVSFPAELTALLLKHKNRLGAIRRWRGFSLAALAEKSDVTESDLAEFEAGQRSPDGDGVSRLADVLGVDPNWLE